MTAHAVPDDPNRYQVSDETWRAIDLRMSDLKRRLGARNGSSIDPAMVLDALQAIMEDRITILPRRVRPTAETFRWSGPTSLPMSAEQWQRLHRLDIGPHGLSLPGFQALRQHHWAIPRLTDVLLMTRQELLLIDGLAEKSVQNLEQQLQSWGLRLPTFTELQQTENTFWCWLNVGSTARVRIAKAILPQESFRAGLLSGVDILSIVNLFTVDTVGELLALSADERRDRYKTNLRRQAERRPNPPSDADIQQSLDRDETYLAGFFDATGLTQAGYALPA